MAESYWKEKCQKAETNLATLKKLAHKGVSDYEELQRKYDQNQKQYEEVKRQLEEAESQLKRLQHVIAPFYEDYQDLRLKYDIADCCRNKAEEFATKVTRQNKELKRQSQMLLERLPVDMDIRELGALTETAEEDNAQEQHYQQLIEDLQEEIVEWTRKAQKAEEESKIALEREKEMEEKLKIQQEISERNEKALTKLKRVSIRAFDEYSDLHEKFDQQKKLKDHAEVYAHEMLSERNAMKRESQIVLSSVIGEDRLMGALLEVEKLTKELEVEKTKSKQKINELEEMLISSDDINQLRNLQEDLMSAHDDIEKLREQLQETNDTNEKLNKQIEELQVKLGDAEERLRPPPPPPPPIPPVMQPFKIRIQKKNLEDKGPCSPDVSKDPRFDGALKEMMDRIQKGLTLRTTKDPKNRRPSLPTDMNTPEKSAMAEMQQILHSMQRSRSTSDSSSDRSSVSSASDDSCNELQRMFAKIGHPPNQANLSRISEEEEASPTNGRRKASLQTTRM